MENIGIKIRIAREEAKMSQLEVGIALGVSSEVPFSSDKIAVEQAWFVEPEFRNKLISIRLVEAFEYWAKEIAQCDVILMSSLNNEEQGKVEKFYSKKGYTLSEKGFLKGLK
jgi:GNAT superfamily N-acetyltransferase